MKLLHKKWKWAVAGILLLGVTVVLFILIIGFWTCCPEPLNEKLLRLRASCQSEGGFFVEALEVCQLPTADAEKSCTDSSECEGFCEADLSVDEITKVTNKEQLKKTGACGKWKNFFSGCFYTVENGTVDKVCTD